MYYYENKRISAKNRKNIENGIAVGTLEEIKLFLISHIKTGKP